jgi:peptidoglycan-associated lipoprotein
VREHLVRLGLDASMIQTITLGEERPAVPGHDESAWSKNRRGEIILLTPPTATAQGGTQ